MPFSLPTDRCLHQRRGIRRKGSATRAGQWLAQQLAPAAVHLRAAHSEQPSLVGQPGRAQGVGELLQCVHGACALGVAR